MEGPQRPRRRPHRPGLGQKRVPRLTRCPLAARLADPPLTSPPAEFLAHCERAHAGQLSRTPGDIPHLQLDSFQKDFLAGQKRLLLVDFEGLLWNIDPRVTHAEGFTPPADLVELLNDLTKDVTTTVYLLSGWSKPDLDKIASQVPRLGLVYVPLFSWLPGLPLANADP